MFCKNKMLASIMLSALMIAALPTSAQAKSCKKIKKANEALFGTSSFKQDIKPFTPGWYKRDARQTAVDGLENYLETEELTPYGQSVIYEYLAQIYDGPDDVKNRREALQNVLSSGGFSEDRNTYIKYLLEDTYLPTFEDKAERIQKRARLPKYPAGFDKKSGHCKVSFSLNPDGSAKNIQVIYCTDALLEEEAIISAKVMQEHLPIDPADTATLEKRRYTGLKMQGFNSKCNLVYPEHYP